MVERILQLIEERGITAYKLTTDLGLNSGIITQWKKGLGKPGTDAIIKIVEYFDVSAYWLMTGKGSREVARAMWAGEMRDDGKAISTPEALKDGLVAAYRGEENWTQEEADRFASIIETAKEGINAQRNKNKGV